MKLNITYKYLFVVGVTFQIKLTMALWHYSVMVLDGSVSFTSIAVRHHSTMALNSYDTMALCTKQLRHYDCITLDNYGT